MRQLILDVAILLHLFKTKRTRKTVLPLLTLRGLKPSTEFNINSGRPKYVIKTEILLHLRSLEFNWNNISDMLLVVVSRWAIRSEQVVCVRYSKLC